MNKGVCTAALALSVAACALAGPVAAAPATHNGMDADALFLKAKEAWRGRVEAPFVTYAVRAQYGYRSRTVDDWFQLQYRASDGALVVHQMVLPDEDARKLRGVPVMFFRLKIWDTNPDADPITMREPAIEPAFTFGLLPHAFLPNVLPAPDSPTPEPDLERLHEIGRVVAVNREYKVTFVGEEKLRYGDALHLSLEPLRDPQLNRLRDIWIAKDTYILLRERVAGIFESKPYDRVSWIVEYVPLNSRMYIQQIHTNDDMKFGIDKVDHLQFDFLDYEFPADVPSYTFEHVF